MLQNIPYFFAINMAPIAPDMPSIPTILAMAHRSSQKIVIKKTVDPQRAAPESEQSVRVDASTIEIQTEHEASIFMIDAVLSQKMEETSFLPARVVKLIARASRTRICKMISS
jgi:hypothetical protein